MSAVFPPLQPDDWRPTWSALHDRVRAVGAIAASLAQPLPHDWHTTLLPDGHIWRTRVLDAGATEFRIELDLGDHAIRVVNRVAVDEFPLPSADAVTRLATAIADQGCDVELDPSEFASGGSYAAEHAGVIADAFDAVSSVLHRFGAAVGGVQSPVQIWPHQFDLTLSWFSGREITPHDPGDASGVDERVTIGLSAGGEAIVDPYLFATAYPMPPEFPEFELPAPSRCSGGDGSFAGGVLGYSDAVGTGRPAEIAMEFYLAFWTQAERAMRW